MEEREEARIRGRVMAEAGELVVIAHSAATLQALLNVIGHQERGSVTQVAGELRLVDMHTRQIEISEMNIAVGNLHQPRTQVRGLRIARDKQDLCAQRIKQIFLLSNQTEILHIFHPDNHHIRWHRERLPVGHKKHRSLRRTDRHALPIEHAIDRFVSIDHKSGTRSDIGQFGVATGSGLLGTGSATNNRLRIIRLQRTQLLIMLREIAA